MYFSTSWDDNCRENEKLCTLLKRYGVKGTFYIDNPQKNTSLIRTLAKEFPIGAHSLSHTHLTKLSSIKQRIEISESKRILEDITQRKIDLFAYPYGDFNEMTKEIVRECGFQFARSTLKNRYYFGQFPKYEMPVSFLFYPTKFERNKNISSFIRVIRNRRELMTLLAIPVRMIPFCSKTILHIIENQSKEIDFLHILGHGWQIEQNNYWNALENLFETVKSFPYIIPVDNQELFILSHQKRKG